MKEGDTVIKKVGVRFKNSGKIYDFCCGAFVLNVGDQVIVEGEEERSYDSGFTLPLPVIGLHGTYAFSDRFRVRGWGQVFSLKYDDYDGTLINAAGMLEYDLFEHFGLGAGYALYSYDLDMDGTDYNGSFSYDFKGPTLFVYASF